jgi:hypothetical protein
MYISSLPNSKARGKQGLQVLLVPPTLFMSIVGECKDIADKRNLDPKKMKQYYQLVCTTKH